MHKIDLQLFWGGLFGGVSGGDKEPTHNAMLLCRNQQALPVAVRLKPHFDVGRNHQGVAARSCDCLVISSDVKILFQSDCYW